MKDSNDFLMAHVELSKAYFSDGENLGIEFKNEIDAWAKMETHFRHQIRNPKKRRRKNRHDLKTTTYSIKHKID